MAPLRTGIANEAAGKSLTLKSSKTFFPTQGKSDFQRYSRMVAFSNHPPRIE
jgi:hypothetical protein